MIPEHSTEESAIKTHDEIMIEGGNQTLIERITLLENELAEAK